MGITAEEKLMYEVMKAIYDSGIPISFKGSNISSMNAWITMPGNFPDFAINMRNASLAHSIVGIMVIGFIFTIIHPCKF